MPFISNHSNHIKRLLTCDGCSYMECMIYQYDVASYYLDLALDIHYMEMMM